MRSLILIIGFLTSLFTYSQEVKEVIKIEIGKECKSCISKRTYVDEIFTKQIKVVSGMYIKAKIGFAYQENFMFEDKGKMIYFHFDQDLFRWYDSKNIYLNIDSVEFNLNLLIDYVKTKSMNAMGETVYIYSLGYILDDELATAIKNSNTINIELIKSSSKKRKSWSLSNSLIQEIVKSYNCFVKYYSPIELKFEEKRKKAVEEYERNLVTFERNYRDSKWHDTKEAVKATQDDDPTVEKDYALSYDVKLNNDDFLAFYYFLEDRLYQGVYVLNEDYVNENNFYAKYKEIKRILISKYGEPKKVTKHRSKDLYDKASEIGMAIQTGEYTEYTSWETKSTTIMLIIEGENFESKLTIRYNTKDPNLVLKVEKENQERRTDGF